MIRRRYSTGLLLSAVVIAAMFVYSARVELIAAIGTASLVFAVLTFLATLAYNLVVWLVFHASAGAGSAYLQTSKMFFGAQVAKYLPGKVWGLVYQATLKSAKMPMGNIVQANIVTYALTVVCAVFACAVLIVYPSSMWTAIAVAIAGAALSVYVFSSDHLYQIIQRFSRLSKRFELTSEVPTIDFSLAARIAIYVLLASLYVLSNVFLLYTFFEFPLAQALRLTAYLGIAWLSGVVVAISPSGLGVREAVFVALGTVTGAGSYELYAGIAIIARAVQVFQDLVFAVLVPILIGLFQKEYESRT